MKACKFPEECVVIGRFKLHSGDITNIFYDVNKLVTNREHLREIVRNVPDCICYVGIATCGAIISSHCQNFEQDSVNAMIKDKELKGQIRKEYCLIDDVVTTESSIKEAIAIIGHNPKHIFVVVDRRKKDERTLDIESMYDVNE